VESVNSVHDLRVYLELMFWELETDTLHTSLANAFVTIVSTVISAFILSKVDYCNVALSGLSNCDLDRLQSVINAAARLTSDACRYDHVTPLLNDLHWLRVPERITYKLCVLV